MEPRTCEQCGRSFIVAYKVSAAQWATRRFCSPKCSSDASRGRPSKRRGAELRPVVDRFWDKVDRRSDDECWEWTGARDVRGYGMLFRSRRPVRWYKSNRLSYELNIGPIPEGLNVLHHCDNPPCCNPRHLYVGTKADNARDRSARGRGKPQKGEQNVKAVLSEADVREIVRLVKEDGMSQVVIAAQFGIQPLHVWRIVHRIAWAHLWEE